MGSIIEKEKEMTLLGIDCYDDETLGRIFLWFYGTED